MLLMLKFLFVLAVQNCSYFFQSLCIFATVFLDFSLKMKSICLLESWHAAISSRSVSTSWCTSGISGKPSLISKYDQRSSSLYSTGSCSLSSRKIFLAILFWFYRRAETKQKSAALSAEDRTVSYWTRNWPIRARELCQLFYTILCYAILCYVLIIFCSFKFLSFSLHFWNLNLKNFFDILLSVSPNTTVLLNNAAHFLVRTYLVDSIGTNVSHTVSVLSLDAICRLAKLTIPGILQYVQTKCETVIFP